MNKAFLLSGVLFSVLGTVLVLGAYSLFNKYSMSGSHHFDQLHRDWPFPSSMLELNEGDSVAVGISVNGEGEGTLYIANTAGSGEKIALSELGNLTAYYHVQTSSQYWCIIDVPSVSTQREFNLTWNIEVTTRAPNLLFQLTGGILLLASAVTIPVAFLYKNKIR